MANKEHVELITKDIREWNKWRANYPKEQPDLREAELPGAKLQGADLVRAKLREADFTRADLSRADLRKADLFGAILRGASLFHSDLREADLEIAELMEADLSGAKLQEVDLSGADLSKADLSGADLSGANLSEADLSKADFREAKLLRSNLRRATLVNTNLSKANLTDCRVYGISAWDLELDKTIQKDLIITPEGMPIITVDSLEVAQFIYLLLHNEKIRDVIDTITSKVVLILGRFTPERKVILEAIRQELRNGNYLPVLFDFEGPRSQDIIETIRTLANMARFIIADITDAKIVPEELISLVPSLPSVPIQPLLQRSKREYVTFVYIKKYSSVLSIHRYRDSDDLTANLKEKVIAPAEAKVLELRDKG